MKRLTLFIFFILLSCSKDSPIPAPTPTTTPTITKFTLTVTAAEGGSVDISGGDYNENSNVTVTATPADGYTFSEWSGNASGSSNPLTVSMTGNKDITANFIRTKYTLNVDTIGQGSVSQEVISSDKTSEEYNSGDVVRLNATPSSGSIFNSWSGSSTETTNQIDVTIDGTKSVTATFEETISQVLGSNDAFLGVGKWKIRKKTGGTDSSKSAECELLEIILRTDGSFTIITSTATITGQFIVDSNTTISLTQSESPFGTITNLVLTNSFISFSLSLNSGCTEDADGDKDEDYDEDTDPNALTYVPDDNFEQVLIERGYDDVLDNYVLTANIRNITGQLSLWKGDESYGIIDLTGIGGFQSVEEIFIINNNITELVLPNMPKLKRVFGGNNNIQNVNFSNTPNLTSIDLSRNNNLSSVDLSQLQNLEYFNCSSCNLSSIDLSLNSKLINLNLGVVGYLGCPDDNNGNDGFCKNHINEIDLTNNTLLKSLNLESSTITELNISNQLELENLHLQNASNIRIIDLSNNSSLNTINIGGTQIEHIDIGHLNQLQQFNATRSQLTSLDISNNQYIAVLSLIQMPSLNCITASQYHLENQLLDGTIDGSSTYSLNNSISACINCNIYISIDETIKKGLSCNPYCTIENTNEVNDLINSFKNYNIGDTYNFGDGDYQVTSKYGGSTEQSGILEGNTYETIRFSSNSDDTNSIWVEFNYSETSGDHLFTYLGRRDTSSTNIWSYVRRYYSPGYEIAPGPFNHYYNINYCNYWIDMIYDLSIIPSVD